MNKAAISFQNVSLAFDQKVVLKNLSLDIQHGESFVLLGRSGSGKSVLLKGLLNLLSFQKGRALIEGQEIRHESEKNQQKIMQKLGMVFQGSALFDSLTVWENIAFQLITPPLKKSKTTAYKEAVKCLDQVGLPAKVADLYPHSLSGGMKRRVALARAIILSPEFLMLDEPTAGLDPVFSSMIGDLVLKLRNQTSITIFTITHDLMLAKKISTRVGVLGEGNLAWTGNFKKMPQSNTKEVLELISHN